MRPKVVQDIRGPSGRFRELWLHSVFILHAAVQKGPGGRAGLNPAWRMVFWQVLAGSGTDPFADVSEISPEGSDHAFHLPCRVQISFGSKNKKEKSQKQSHCVS